MENEEDKALIPPTPFSHGMGEGGEEEFPARLAAWTAPEPTPEETGRLIARLEVAVWGEAGAQRAVEQRAKEQPAQAERTGWRLDDWWPWLMLRGQARVVRQEIWLASALVMALGLLVALAGRAGLPLTLAAPLVAALGIAFLYGPDDGGLLEVELVAPAAAQLVLLARLALVFAFNLLLGLAASAALALLLGGPGPGNPIVGGPGLAGGGPNDAGLAGGGPGFWALVTSWLAPMACLSALAFCLAALFSDPNLSAVICLVLWAWHSAGELLAPARLPLPHLDLAATELRLGLWLAAAGLVLAGLWLAGRQGRWINPPG